MNPNDERWRQRLRNLNRVFGRLAEACAREEFSDLELAGLVQTYEFTFELAWKTLRDKLLLEGYQVDSPRGTIRQAFAAGLIADGPRWLEALESRNLLTHTYDDAVARQAIGLIKVQYAPLLRTCVENLNAAAASLA